MSSDTTQPLNRPLDADSGAEHRARRRSQLLGLAVCGVVLLPMLAAYLMFTTGWGIPTGTVNKGDLLSPPLAVELLDLRDVSGNPVDLLSGDKKWRLLIPAGAACDESCQHALYVTRQVHVRLGDKATRIERYYLNTAPALDVQTQAFIEREHPRLKVAYIDGLDLAALQEASAPAGARYFLMDQEGFVMMSYNDQHSGNELLDDIKRLLKYSYEGQ